MSEITTAIPIEESAPKKRVIRRKTTANQPAQDTSTDTSTKTKSTRPRKKTVSPKSPDTPPQNSIPAESATTESVADSKIAPKKKTASDETLASALSATPAPDTPPPTEPSEPTGAPQPEKLAPNTEVSNLDNGKNPAVSVANPPQSNDLQRSGHKHFKSRRFFKRGRFKAFKNRQNGELSPDQRATPTTPTSARETVSEEKHSGDESSSEQTLETFPCEGVLELSGKGFGFLRERVRAYQQHPQDVFVTPEYVRRYGLRDGMMLAGRYRRGGRGPQMVLLETINGGPPERFKITPLFEELTAVNPEKRFVLETAPDRHTTRVIDLITPIGMGQRGLIVAPPRTGKTTLLMHIAEAILANHHDVHLLVLLVDERPEEVTEFKIHLPQAELWASSNDSDVKSHTRMATLCLDRAKRMVEDGKHVFLILDSITRVGRAFNNAIQGTGRTLTGGMDARGMEIPRRLFAAARNTEEAGSLTIIATALIETGSRMDELIFQEFKGTGNMELVLDRRIAEQRIYPAVDIFKSGTRREELLVPEEQLEKISLIRRGLAGHKPVEAIERLLFFIRKFPTNKAMLEGIPG